MTKSLQRPRIAYYGDDFTGSTDVMEVLWLAGVPTVLFTQAPTPEDLALFPEAEAVGLAGMSRTMSPDEMDRDLAPALRSLAALRPQVLHYKVCSTLDSSPTTGSIGRAIDIGQRLFRSPWVPLVIGGPRIRRYTVFGHLFAGFGEKTFRIDRHPTMSKHPQTPMDESDILTHLGRQTDRPGSLFDLRQLAGSAGQVDERFATLLASQKPELVLFDLLDDGQLEHIGRLIWTAAQQTQEGTFFSASSSGLEYALVSHWHAAGTVAIPPPRPAPTPVDQLLVASGSCSLQTDAQIAHALENGFAGIDVDVAQLLDPGAGPDMRSKIATTAGNALGEGRSVVIHTARGVADPAIARRGADLGQALGKILNMILEHHPLPRVLVAGGDTSGHVTRALGIKVLQPIAVTAPGSPLCRAEGRDEGPLEIVLKGGQVGRPDFFTGIKTGHI